MLRLFQPLRHNGLPKLSFNHLRNFCSVEHAKTIIKRANAVCFDVDSTVCTEEGIDVLANFCGVGEAVTELTSKAMGGSTPFREALKARLDLINPTFQQLEACIAQNPPKLSSGIKQVVNHLHARGTVVFLVSGGFRQMIAPVARILEIPEINIFANTLIFNKDGTFSGFDTEEPTSKSGGKAMAIDLIKRTNGYKTMVMIGDGMTDAEAKPPADAFIGYGGVVTRNAVKKKADWFIYDFQELIDVLQS